jgi:polar amino acid transport system substrate-binding protein
MKLALWVVLLLLLGQASSRAETVLEEVSRTGILTAGTREDARPFAFRGDDGQLTGFAVDLLRAITERAAATLNRPVELQLVPVTAQNRLEMVRDGRIAIECGLTTMTWAREQEVDFSIPFYANGTRVLALRRTARTLADLANRQIGVLAGSTTLGIIRAEMPEARPVEVPDMRRGLEMLLNGEIDGLANVGTVLRAQIEDLEGKSRFVLLPAAGSLSWESLACVLPSGDSAWRDLVNQTIAGLLDGVERYRGRWVEIYERWFGPQGDIFYPLDQSTAERLAALRVWLN